MARRRVVRNGLRWEVDEHIRYLLQRHGLVGRDAERAKKYMENGFSNDAAITLAKAGGDHSVLLRRQA